MIKEAARKNLEDCIKRAYEELDPVREALCGNLEVPLAHYQAVSMAQSLLKAAKTYLKELSSPGLTKEELDKYNWK